MTRAWSIAAIAVCMALTSGTLAAGEPSGPIAEKLKTAKVTQYARAPGYSEGPTWRDGEVFFCSGALLRVDKDRNVTKYLDIAPAGTFLKADGNMLVCGNKQPTPALLEVSPNGAVDVIVDQFDGKPLGSLNDLTVDAGGNVFWSDPKDSSAKNPIGSIYRVTPAGLVAKVASGLAFPNGLDVDPASRKLYVIESQSQKILSYELRDGDAPLGKAELFYDLGGSGGDGCAFDAEGNLWVADFHRKETNQGRITVLSTDPNLNPEARVLGYLDIPAKVVSNITFGGADRDEIFCTTGDPPGVFHARVGVKGFAGHPGKPMLPNKPKRKLDVKPEATKIE